MLLKSKFLRLSFTLTLLLSMTLLAFADTIRLKDGSIVKGRVIGFKDGQFVIVIGEGSRQRQMSFYSDEIESIEFEQNSSLPTTKVSSAPTSTPRPNPTPIATPTPSNPNVRVIGTQTETTAKNTPQPTPQPTPVKVNDVRSAVQLNAKVLADNTGNGWTNTGWVVKKGQRIKISGTGRISLGNGRYSTPSGIATLPENTRIIKNKPTGGLIAVIGDDNNDFIFVGSSYEFVASRDGSLFLGVNECDGCLDDNSGAFEVVVEVDPN
jgi:hypothetical protein